jgi:hypothetical protein
MAKAGYAVETSAAVALSAATVKTALFVLAPAQFGMDLRSVAVSFDGVTTTDKPVLIEVTSLTGATNSTPGTANTNENANIDQLYGRAVVAGFVAGSACTSEPTVQSCVKQWLLTPNGGTFDYDWPLGETLDSDVSKGFAVRLTAPTSAVNARCWMRFERC